MRIYILDAEKNFGEELCKDEFPKRYERAEKFALPGDRARCIGIGVLFSRVLKINEGDIKYNRYGKPYCEKTENFSVSHSGNYCVLAIDKNEIGVDIEKTKGKHPHSNRFFATEETEFLNSGEPNGFYAVWTMKESLGKALGTGLNAELRDINILPLIKGEPLIAKGRKFFGKSVVLGEYVLSVCAENEPPDARITFLSEEWENATQTDNAN